MCESNCSRPIVRQHFSFPQDISRMAIFSEFNICTFLLRASNVDVLDHLEKFLAFVMSTLHSIAAVSSSVSSNLAEWTISEYLPLSVPVVPDASFLRSSFQSLFCVCFPDFDLAEPFRRMFWWRMCSPSCAAGCIFSNVVPVLVFAVRSFTSSDQAIHFQGFSHQYARTS